MPPLNIAIAPLLGSQVYYQGPSLEKGIQPTVIFFALSAQMSLTAPAFSEFVMRLVAQGVRVFSWDLPFHGQDQDPQEAMRKWAQEWQENPRFLTDFLDLCQENVRGLIEQGWIDPHAMAVAGLSRGGLIATHLAARDQRFKAVLGFAPLTRPQTIEEMQAETPRSLDQVALISLVDHLVHLPLRFYIGNRDTRVSTDACYQFIRTLTEAAFNQGVRSPQTEFILYPSIGYKGHGTPPAIFADGADWIKQRLIGEAT